MPKIAYIEKRFSDQSLYLIEQANQIIAQYEEQGFSLTLRQLYYQLVARDLLPDSFFDPKFGSTNNPKSYKKLGSVINDARLAGLIDWRAIEDRTRNLRSLSHWRTPAEIVGAVGRSYRLDKWETQNYRPEVWVEKDALGDVVARAAQPLDVPFFSCRGYTSQSEMWGAAQRFRSYARQGQTPFVIHLGDHDPSGIDMTRDIIDRLEMFTGGEIAVERIALNFDQVQQYNPPPNPAKENDSRATGYIADFGTSSWELDALEPRVLVDLITRIVEDIIEWEEWNKVIDREMRERSLLQTVGDRWTDVEAFLSSTKNGSGRGNK